MGYKIAIDGPAGTGKGFVACEISKILGIMYVDTGAMYRAFALYCYNNNIDVENYKQIEQALGNVKTTLLYDNQNLKVLLNDEDVSEKIRNENISMLASVVSSIPIVREYMVESQRNLAGTYNVIMEGRDIGSVVFPDAELKIFLTAKREVRAQRRYKDLALKNSNITYEEVLEDIIKRDERDTTRKISPLIKTEDMIEIDTTYLNKQEVINKVMELIRQKELI